MTEKELELIEMMVEEYRETLISKVNTAQSISLNERGAEVTFDTYANVIANYFCVDKAKMLSRNTRLTEYKIGRQVLWFLCRSGESQLPYSLQKLGNISGGFNHATVLHGTNKIAGELPYDNSLMSDVKQICKVLGFQLIKTGRKHTTVRAI